MAIALEVTDLRHPGIVTLVLLLLLRGVPGGDAQATGGADCFKTQCEDKGRTCVQSFYVTYETCMKAGRKKCDRVQPADKFDCLTAELKPCALTRNDEQAQCLAGAKSCYALCGQIENERTAYWCVVEFDNMVTAAFCAADMTSARPMEQCEEALSGEGPLGSMTCDPL